MNSHHLDLSQRLALRDLVTEISGTHPPAYQLQWMFGDMDDYYKACVGIRKTTLTTREILNFKKAFHVHIAKVRAKHH